METKRRSDGIVDELRRLKELGKANVVEEETRNFVVFTLHDGVYAFEGADVKEILSLTEIFPVPGTPKSVPGVINNRGDIEAVVKLHPFLGLAESERTASSRIVMTEKAGLRVGILVDSVLDVVDLQPSSIKPPLATLNDATRELVAGEMICKGKNVVLLDVGRIIDALRANGS